MCCQFVSTACLLILAFYLLGEYQWPRCGHSSVHDIAWVSVEYQMFWGWKLKFRCAKDNESTPSTHWGSQPWRQLFLCRKHKQRAVHGKTAMWLAKMHPWVQYNCTSPHSHSLFGFLSSTCMDRNQHLIFQPWHMILRTVIIWRAAVWSTIFLSSKCFIWNSQNGSQ